MVNSTSYQPPIDKLLTLGSQQFSDVAKLGIGSEHIPDLIQMAVDNKLLGADNEKDSWAPVHAWHILGQLQATNAIIPLIQLFKLEENDLVNEELPKVFANIGNAAIPALAEYLASQENQLLARVTAINSLEEIANQHSDARNQIKNVLIQSLQSCNQNPSELNGFIVSTLINLQAQEAAPVIKYAFNTNQVAEDIVGNWDEVRESLSISTDEEIQEFIPTPPDSITEVSTPDVEEASEDEINALIDLVAEVTETQTSTQEDAVPTNESTSEVIETETQTEQNTLVATELASELADIETQTQENAVFVNESTSEVVEIDTQTEDIPVPTSDNASETNNISVPLDQPVKEEIEEVVSEVEASPETQVTVETPTQIDESHEQTKDDKTEAIVQEPREESSEELNLLEQEDNKGFGRPGTSKEKPEKSQKAKPSKKKKRGFSDL